MDGNRTQPGRLNSAPQTVLRTSFFAFNVIRRGPQIQSPPEASDNDRTRAKVREVAVRLAIKRFH